MTVTSLDPFRPGDAGGTVGQAQAPEGHAAGPNAAADAAEARRPATIKLQGEPRVRDPRDPDKEGTPWWVAAALLAIFGAAMFLSGYLVGRG